MFIPTFLPLNFATIKVTLLNPSSHVIHSYKSSLLLFSNQFSICLICSAIFSYISQLQLRPRILSRETVSKHLTPSTNSISFLSFCLNFILFFFLISYNSSITNNRTSGLHKFFRSKLSSNLSLLGRDMATRTLFDAEKFDGKNFRRWQEEIYFHLYLLKLDHMLHENALNIDENMIDYTTIIKKRKRDDFLCRGELLNANGRFFI